MIEIDFSTFRGAFTPLAPLFFFLRRAILKTGDFQISHLGGGGGVFNLYCTMSNIVLLLILNLKMIYSKMIKYVLIILC